MSKSLFLGVSCEVCTCHAVCRRSFGEDTGVYGLAE